MRQPTVTDSGAEVPFVTFGRLVVDGDRLVDHAIVAV
jgi:hypothetical protein